MGEEEKQPQLYANVCGEWKPVKAIDATPVLESATSSAQISREALLAPITIRARLPKYFRCRSRKRLIKLLMANKFSRREAEGAAWYFHDLGWSYHDAWQAAWPGLMYK